ncbi:SPOSA6832_03029 [Sporobolomyces salmonicolor]|uniref:SPOSA6832_03029-mRNA-1:cds n=1 Tax=Sporidiobolus salmonicolor TaxID=5005 RepID=A0A0D6EN75_SPOSA|nr:SPOSA6832_03029 [Sporobolomyces salmonicolor]
MGRASRPSQQRLERAAIQADLQIVPLISAPAPPHLPPSMAGPAPQQISLTQTLLKAQYKDPESWEANKVVLTAFGTFTACVVFISQFGDLLIPQF